MNTCPNKHKMESGPADILIRPPGLHRKYRKERDMFFLTTECLSMLISQSGVFELGVYLNDHEGCDFGTADGMGFKSAHAI